MLIVVVHNHFTMNRRKFLALVTAGAGLGGGGYLGWNWYNTPTIPSGMDVETLHVERDVSANNFSRDGESLAWEEEYHTVIEDRETADRELESIDSVTKFIEDTNFEESYIVVVQNGMQSDPDLELDTINRVENGINIEVSIDAPRVGGDDLINHSLLIRITDSEDGLPETITVDIEGYV